MVLSEDYKKSPYCKMEFETFIKHNKVYNSSGITNCIVVRLDSKRSDNDIAEVDGIDGFRFYYLDGKKERKLTIKTQDDRYEHLIEDIADASIEFIRYQNEQKALENQTNKNILLSQVSDDLIDTKDEIQAFLESEGYKVFYKDATNVKDVKLVIQLLSLEDNIALTSKEQIDIFNKSPIVWCSRETYTDREKIKNKLKIQYELLENSALVLELEDFKKHIVKKLKDIEAFEKEIKDKSNTKPNSRPYVFINADKDDVNLARKISSKLGNRCEIPPIDLSTENAHNIEQNIKQHTMGCDFYILVYGNSEYSWVQRHLNSYFICKKQREKKGEHIKALIVYKGPPRCKQKSKNIEESSGIRLDNMYEIDEQASQEFDKLEIILDNFKSSEL
jgi:hypothetical protein